MALAAFGEGVPFGDPSWYQGQRSPYYGASHVAWRARCREFVDEVRVRARRGAGARGGGRARTPPRLDDYAGLEKLIETLPEGSQLLCVIGERLPPRRSRCSRGLLPPRRRVAAGCGSG